MAETQQTTQQTSSIMDPYLNWYWDSVKSDWNRNNSQWAAPYSGQTVTPMSSQTQSALGGIQGLAGQGNPLNQQAMNYVGGLLGGNAISTGGMLQDLYNNSGNQAYQGVIDTQAGKLQDGIDRAYSASGRYGSAAHSGTVVDQVGDFRSQAAANQWNQNIQNQSNILGQIGSVQNQNAQLGLAGAAMTPTLYQQQYAPYDRMASVGAAYDDLTTRQLQANKDYWTANNNRSTNALQQLGGLLGAVGSSGGGTTYGSVQQPTNYGQYIGAGLAGAQALGGVLGSLSSIGSAGGGVASSWSDLLSSPLY